MKSVLIVEDVDYWVRRIQRALEHVHVRVAPAALLADSEALCAWTTEQAADVALVDLSLAPDFTGFDLARAWVARGYAPGRLVFITLEPTPRDLAQALELGGELLEKTLATDWRAVVA